MSIILGKDVPFREIELTYQACENRINLTLMTNLKSAAQWNRHKEDIIMERRIRNIGIISTRIAGTDGVSLEIRKWTDVLERNGYSRSFFAGEIDRAGNKSYQADLAHFRNPDVEKSMRTVSEKQQVQ